MNYWLIFLTGLTTGGLACAAVQGSLLAALLANRDGQPHPDQTESGRSPDLLPVVMFLVSKLVAYTILGALLGYFGSVFQLSLAARIGFQVVAAVLLLGLAANLVQLHPVFGYFVLQPPRWVGRLIKNQTKSRHVFAPAVLGLFTVFLPCVVTQAMEILAISSGSPVSGALIMASFTLGTAPLFVVIGWVTTRLSAAFRRRFTYASALAVVFVALVSLNGALVLSGSRYSWAGWVWAFKATFVPQTLAASPPAQQATITASGGGYSPRQITVKVGEPVTLNLVTQGNYSCSSVFTIPSLGITQSLPVTGTAQVTFTPTETGPLAFACGMGMFTGTINVVP